MKWSLGIILVIVTAFLTYIGVSRMGLTANGTLNVFGLLRMTGYSLVGFVYGGYLVRESSLETPNIGNDFSFYAGFWRRAAAASIDAIIIVMIYGLTVKLFGNNNLIVLVIIYSLNVLIVQVGKIVCLSIWGGTPGKLLFGVQVVSLGLNGISFFQAFVRELPDSLIAITYVIFFSFSLHYFKVNGISLETGKNGFQSLFDVNGFSMRVVSIVQNYWMLSELVVLLLNKRKRSLHDYLAGTVVVVKKMLPKEVVRQSS